MDDETFSCGICLEKFNENEKQPYTLIPCGHDFCIECIRNWKQSTCSVCRAEINGDVINRGILRHLSLNLVKDPNAELKNSITRSKKHLEEFLTTKINNKKAKNTAKLDIIKKEIIDHSTKLIKLIELNKNDLLKGLKKNENILNCQIDDSFKSLKDETEILIKENLKELNTYDLIKYDEKLQEMLKALDTNIDQMADYDLNIKLQLNNVQPTKNFIGELTNDNLREVANESTISKEKRKINHSKDPTSYTFYKQGNFFKDMNNHQGAIKCYDKIIQTNPNDSEAYYCKGNSLNELKQYQEAVYCYDTVIKLNPNCTEAFCSKANSLYNLNKFQEAIDCCHNVIQLNPSNLEAYHKKGFLFYKLKKYQEAIGCYNDAIKLDSKNPLIYYNKGLSLNDLQKYQEAIDCYGRAIQLNPNYAEAFYCIGNSLNDLNREQEASHYYEKAIQLNPSYSEAYDAINNLKIKRLKI